MADRLLAFLMNQPRGFSQCLQEAVQLCFAGQVAFHQSVNLLLRRAIVQQLGALKIADARGISPEVLQAFLLYQVAQAVLILQVLVGQVDAELVNAQLLCGGGAAFLRLLERLGIGGQVLLGRLTASS